MNDEQAPETPNLPQVLPAFTPVPRVKERTNGWKPEVQRLFIEALAETVIPGLPAPAKTGDPG